MRRFKAIALIVSLLHLSSGLAQAYELGVTGMGEKMQGPGFTSEYVYRNDTEESLIPVYLLGAVAKPGLYHVPANMDVIGLLTIAGGTVVDAVIDDIVVRSQGQNPHPRVLRFDLNRVVKGGEAERVALASNDLIYVAPGRPPVPSSQTALTVIGIVAGVLGIVGSAFVISNALK